MKNHKMVVTAVALAALALLVSGCSLPANLSVTGDDEATVQDDRGAAVNALVNSSDSAPDNINSDDAVSGSGSLDIDSEIKGLDTEMTGVNSNDFDPNRLPDDDKGF
ncbi:hypothetical protein HY933_01035 [Candidatus Falkowbacteria bacterium]|nr:hypothetical protein [Candidatus Falkowbacteria bacterium]